jgi:hypothetical protein
MSWFIFPWDRVFKYVNKGHNLHDTNYCNFNGNKIGDMDMNTIQMIIIFYIH